MRPWFSTLLTTTDGKSDTMLTLCVIGVLSFIGFGAYAYVWKGQAFDPFGYAAGFGGMISASAAGLGIRTKLMATPTSIGSSQ